MSSKELMSTFKKSEFNRSNTKYNVKLDELVISKKMFVTAKDHKF